MVIEDSFSLRRISMVGARPSSVTEMREFLDQNCGVGKMEQLVGRLSYQVPFKVRAKGERASNAMVLSALSLEPEQPRRPLGVLQMSC